MAHVVYPSLCAACGADESIAVPVGAPRPETHLCKACTVGLAHLVRFPELTFVRVARVYDVDESERFIVVRSDDEALDELARIHHGDVYEAGGAAYATAEADTVLTKAAATLRRAGRGDGFALGREALVDPAVEALFAPLSDIVQEILERDILEQDMLKQHALEAPK